MPNINYRIKANVNNDDDVIRVNLKQGVKTLNILSLEINPEDAYDIRTSDYGVIVGRVLANNSYGVPNVKVSVFIPITAEDEDNYVISNEYPFKTPQSRDRDGVKYNLLAEGEGKPGTFPNKNMLLSNDGCIEVFDKYWKYTVTTNDSGDYMIFGVPTGTTQVHYDCDLSDIGLLSQHPYDFVAKGYSPNLFKSMNEFTDTDVNTAVHILSQDKTVYVYPFWGNKDANKIGITRNDINLDYEFTPSCVFMGSSITDSQGSYIGIMGNPNGSNGRFETLATSTGNIEVIRRTVDGQVEELKDNVVGIIDGNGVWCYQIPMNLDRIGMDEYGNVIAVNDPNKGIPTRARVRFRISLTDTENPDNSEYTAKLLVPCNPDVKMEKCDGVEDLVRNVDDEVWENIYEFGSKTPDSCFRDLYWNKVYSVKQFYPRFQYEYPTQDRFNSKNTQPVKDIIYGDAKARGTYFQHELNAYPYIGKDAPTDSSEISKERFDLSAYPTRFAFPMSCISSIDMISGLNPFPYTTLYAGAEEHIDYHTSYWFQYHMSDDTGDERLTSKGLHFCFENDWINGCLYFPRVIIKMNGEGYYDYFGKKNDENEEYSNIYATGRHCWYVKDGELTTICQNVTGNGYGFNILQQDVLIFSRLPLGIGILTCKKTMLNDNIFYYRCGGEMRRNRNPHSATTCTFYRRLYSTDIILLGNLDDVFDNLPKLYNQLPATTTTFPPVSPPKSLNESGMSAYGYTNQIQSHILKDSLVMDIFNNYYKDTSDYSKTISGYIEGGGYAKQLYDDTCLATGLDTESEENVKELIVCLLNRYSLFFGLCIQYVYDYLYYNVPTFVNTSRICELDVHNDAVYVAPCDDNTQDVIPINGLIDLYDISTHENRSAFASMNHDITKCTINKLGHKEYTFTPLAVVGFDGRLSKYIDNNSYQHENRHLAVDDKCESYYKFRFGEKGLLKYYNEWGSYKPNDIVMMSEYKVEKYCNGDLIIPQNSFYFYFGLRSGYSALDVFKEKYIGLEKEVTTKTAGIMVSQDMHFSSISCQNGVEYTSCNVHTYGLTPPLEYKIYKENQLVQNGVSGTTNFVVTDIPVGLCKIEITDVKGVSTETMFATLPHSIKMDASAEIDELTKIPTLSVFKVAGSTINTCQIVDSHDNSKGINVFLDNSVFGGVLMKFTPSFSKFSFNNETKIMTVDFGEDAKSVKIELSVLNASFDCIKSSINYTFIEPLENDLELNGVPVKYISNWATTEGFIQPDSPDYAFINAGNFNLWDSLNTAQIDPLNKRGYNFPDNLSYEKKIECVSKMFTAVFDDGGMQLKNTVFGTNYLPVALSPNYKKYSQHFHDSISHWGDSLGILYTSQLYYDTLGYVNTDIPHIVGSNFARNFDWRTCLASGATEGNYGYVNNATIKSSQIGKDVNGEIFGVNLFACPHLLYKALDKPLQNLNPRQFVSGGIDTPLKDVNGYYGVRTVDKRFDYRFAANTPLLLPSGYDIFTNLNDKTFAKGGIWVDLFGGIRLNYIESGEGKKQLTSYSEGKNGPDSNAQLFKQTIYEDDNTDNLDELTITPVKVWDDDIDEVQYEAPVLTHGIQSVTCQFVGCNSDFRGGSVSPGKEESITISYESGVEIQKHETEIVEVILNNKPWEIHQKDYDLLYDIPNLTLLPTTGATIYTGSTNASFSGNSLSFTLKHDSNWDGAIYTDSRLNPSGNNDDVYPEWVSGHRISLNGIPRPLSIYMMDPSLSGLPFAKSYELDFNHNPQYANLKCGGEKPSKVADEKRPIMIFCDQDVEEEPVLPISNMISQNYANFTLKMDEGKIYKYDGNKWSSATSVTEEDYILKENAFLTIPTRQVYTKRLNVDAITGLYSEDDIYYENNDSSRQRQGVVTNLGYVYYASVIEVKFGYQEFGPSSSLPNLLYIKLFTPLRDSDGKINTNATSLTPGNNWHTIGEIDMDSIMCQYIFSDPERHELKNKDALINYTERNSEGYFQNIEYDALTATFIIPIPDRCEYNEDDEFHFYFSMKNGLTYKIRIKWPKKGNAN